MQSDAHGRRTVLAKIRTGELAVDEALRLLKGSAGTPDEAPQAQGEHLRRRLETWLAEILAAEARIPLADVRPAEPLDRYGFDSVMALDVVRALEADFGTLSPTLLFEHQTVAALAEYLAQEHGATAERLLPGLPGSSAPAPAVVPAAQVTPAAPTDGAIAVVGLSGRFPLADDLDEFWANLEAGRDCVTEIPAERWDHRRHFDPEPGKPGRSYSKWGGFLREVDAFDAEFFRVSPREAERMDPQERLFLQEAWHALEDGGLAKSRVSGRQVGVYVGVMYSQYQLIQAEQGVLGNPLHLGSSYASIANRVSHFLDLRGPSMAVDTMCSSSLTALHLACEALRRGDIEMALAGGVNLTVHANKYLDLSQGRYASTDGRCRSFGEGGDGYVPGEGVGVAVLKPLTAALADGDRIHAVIRGSALGHGGRTNGYSVPNPKEQARLIGEAYRQAGVDPRRVTYIEAHGTGTSLGDPIEITALDRALGAPAPGAGPRAIGSVKSNIGHLESAAGIAGLAKVVLQLRHRRLVPSLHAERLNPHIDFDATGLRVQRTLQEWESEGGPRTAGLSSFGAGGANAHVIIEEYVPAARQPAPEPESSPELILLSAQTEERLRAWAGSLAAHLDRPATAEPVRLADIAYTLRVGREPLDVRLAFVAASVNELVATLGEFARTGEVAGAVRGNVLRDAAASAATPLSQLPAERRLIEAGRLWAGGAATDWPAAPHGAVRRVGLPGYPFARERHWPALVDATIRPGRPGPHPLLDANLSTFDRQRFITSLAPSSPWLRDHRVSGRRVLPAAALLEMVLAAGRLSGLGDRLRIEDSVWEAPVDPEGPYELTVELTRLDGQIGYTVTGTADGRARRGHARGLLTVADAATSAPLDLTRLREGCGEAHDADTCYRIFAERGLAYGDTLRALEHVRSGDGYALGRVRLGAAGDRTPGYLLHPALLDAAFQTLIAFDRDGAASGAPRIPFAVDRVDATDTLPEQCWVLARARGGASDESGRPQVFDLSLADDDGRVLAEITGLLVRPAAAPAAHRTVRLRPEWRRTEPLPAGRPEGRILLLESGPALGDALAALGLTVVRARTGPGFADLGEGRYELDPRDDAQYEQLLDALLSGPGALDAVIHAWTPTVPLAEAAMSQDQLDLGFHSLLALARAWSGRASATGLRLLSAHPAGAVAQGAFAAFGRALAAEQPSYAFTSVELPAGHPVDADAALLAAELTAVRAGAVEVQHRDGVRSVSVLADHTPGQAGGAELREHGVYLVTGALGGLGRVLAAHLARRVRARLVLAGRSSLDERGAAFLGELREAGADVVYVAADCATEEGARRLVATARERYGRLDGVVHLAGILRDGLVLRKRREEAEAVLHPKIWGAHHLDRASAGEQLDFFALFSSVSSVTGVAGQADYGYANAFLNGFADWREDRRRAGERSGTTVSVAWPLWEAGGMDVDDTAKQWIEEHLGWVPLPVETGLELFEETLRGPESRVALFHGHRPRILGSLGLTEEEPDRDSASLEDSVPLEEVREVRPRPGLAPAAQGLLAHLTRAVAAELKLPVERLDPRTRFERLGLESVMVMNLTRDLEALFGTLPKTLFFEYQCLADLCAHLVETHPDAVAARFGTATAPHDAAPAASATAVPRTAPVSAAVESRTAPVPAAVPPARRGGTDDEPIAIVGVSGRYPMADTLDEFWANLRQGRDCITEIPKSRWDHARYYDPAADAPGKSYSKWGGFLQDVDRFDPLFFNISPREAKLMDPQERLFLETAWHTLEDAGHSRATLAGRRVGVFVGVMYAQYQLHGAHPAMQARGFVPASLSASVANRVSYTLDLTGPSLALDTMCSSSLTALHLACASIRLGDCDEAIAGGVNAILHPNRYLQLSQAKFASTDGRCRSFGEGGDGYVPGEGVGAVLLKPLSRAEADGDHIYAVVRGSAVNHGGRSNGYTVPTPVGQGEVIARALRNAGVRPAELDYIEAHGTGTSLGDPIEVAGLVKAFAQEGAPLTPDCPIGSVKSAIGHLESAAGIAGLTKILLQFRHGELVPSLHAERLNPNIDFEGSGFRVQRTLEPWPARSVDERERPRIAAVSSFGAGGTNAHVIVEQYQPREVAVAAAERAEMITLSARTEDQLNWLAEALADRVSPGRAGAAAGAPAYRLCDIAFTLQAGREPREERLAVVAENVADLAAKLRGFSAGEDVQGLYRGRVGAEAGPWSSLLEGGDGEAFLAAVRRAGDLGKLARLWVSGVDLAASALPPAAGARRVPLPTYPFARDRYWLPEDVDTAVPAEVAPNAYAPQAPAAPPVAVVAPEPEAAPWDRVREVVVEAMADVLEVPAAELGLDVPHSDFGVDSVLAVEIVDRINRDLGSDLKPTDFFSYATPRRLTDHVAATGGLKSPAAVPTPPAAVPTAPVVPAVPPAGPVTVAPGDVAVIGMSGRFPDAGNLDQLWANLAAGRDSVREIPAERWDVDRHWDADPQAPGKTYGKWGSVLADIDRFDPDFFGMSPREARLMDPQQRLYMMEAWRALEDAGYSDRMLDGTECHAFVGTAMGDYHHLLRENGVPIEGYTFMGTHPAVLSSRLSYHLNLRGPSLAVDTSCSSSLMAVHLACEAIRSGRCELAVAGGVAALSTPELHILASKAGMLSPTGRCRSFDDSADGFVPGEGVGVLVLKSLEKALADGDHIHGVIAASGANQDGRSSGITAPSMPAQQELEQSVYERFGIDPDRIGYVECHGTGTRLGDPIEIEALTRTFRATTARTHYCAIGSIKSNLGHTLTAAGVAGVIKTLLSLKHGQLPPSLHFDQPNRYIPFADSPFYVNTALSPWPRPVDGGPRLAAVSSFGFSGTNVHAVLREAPALPARPAEQPGRAWLVPVSAKSERALDERLSALSGWLATEGGRHEWRDIAHTLGAGRSHFAVRAAFVARSPQELGELIAEYRRSGRRPQAGTGPLAETAERYLAGAEPDWEALRNGEPCRRVPLPTYPFADERYWVPGTETSTPTARPALREGEERVFHHRLAAAEPLVHDHIVDGRPLLPAAGHLSLVHHDLRELAGDTPVTLTRAVWLRPLFVAADRDIEIVIRGQGAGRYSFEVRGAEPDGSTVAFSSGTACTGAGRDERVDLAAVRARCADRLTEEQHYGLFTRMDIRYGPSFRTVREIGRTTTEALAALFHDGAGPDIPAGILDGAVQTVAALQPDTGARRRPQVPFAMDEIHVLRPVPRECFAHVRQTKAGECTVSIVDAEGRSCIVIEGFSYRELKEPVRTRLYLPRWRELGRPAVTAAGNAGPVLVVAPPRDHGLAARIADRHRGARVDILRLDPAAGPSALAAGLARLPRPERVYFLGGLPQDPAADLLDLAACERGQELGLRSLFRLTRALLANGAGERSLVVTSVTADGHALAPGEQPRPNAAALFGFTRSLAKEQPSWRVGCLDVGMRELAEHGEAVADAVVAEPGHPQGDETVLREGRRWARVLTPMETAEPAGPAGTPLRQGGTYLILGGAGGIGAELAVHLARRAAANVVLLGRRPHSPAVEERLRAIEAAGGRGLYLQADGTDEAAMAAAVATARQRFGPIHGAFHSALVLRDGRIDRLDEAAFEAALTPKVTGALVLARVLRTENPDFLVFFSSANSFSGNLGQSNYAAGCTFKDAFATALAATGVPARIVNWGYWGEVGIVAKPGYRRRMEALGVHSIGVAEGMAALETVLAHRIPQAMPLKAEQRVLERFGVVDEAGAAGTPGERLRRAHAGLGALGASLAARSLQELGAFRTAGDERSAARLADDLAVVPGHRELFDALVGIVTDAGFLARAGDRLRATRVAEELAGRDLEAEAKQLIADHAEVAAHTELLTACLAEYPQLLRGETDPTEVMFPGSSMERVERIYRGDPLSDRLNALAAEAVEEHLAGGPSGAPLRILEVGAGTGGTTERVLKAVAPYGTRVEYVYTDLSLGFLRHGRQRFAAEHPFMTFTRLDIEKDPVDQGFGRGGFDLVVAANVLHATKDLRRTLAHVALLLGERGRLVLSETTGFTAFTTLTFGLLDGWWLRQDRALRIPGSPLADVPTWQRLLAEAGFAGTTEHSPVDGSPDGLGQHLLVADRRPAVPVVSAVPVEAVAAVPVVSAGAAVAETPPAAPAHPAVPAPRPARTGPDRAAVQDLLAASIAETLGRADTELDPDRPFIDFGVSSIILVELVDRLNARLGTDLKTTALFDHPTLAELTEHVCTDHAPALAGGAGTHTRADPEAELLERLAAGEMTAEQTYARLERVSE
ncbi:SDR family NAD(P)-dependent oxidoreductase [Streptomyces sp. bgisy091]|uniref:SDR family NAD(P)-dependent oxidoreductase n=1 Tax=Streptomyces sp. bgisy091 TaxID=3413778 RepID=UPI003D72B471